MTSYAKREVWKKEVSYALVNVRPSNKIFGKSQESKYTNTFTPPPPPTPYPHQTALSVEAEIWNWVHTRLWTHSTSQQRKWHIVGGDSAVATRIWALSSWWHPLQWEIKTQLNEHMVYFHTSLPNLDLVVGGKSGLQERKVGGRNGVLSLSGC